MIRRKFNMNNPREREDYYAYRRLLWIIVILGLVLMFIASLTPTP